MKKHDFIDEFNEFKIRKCTRDCNCKICDKQVNGKDIIYIKSFRLQAQPFHICLDCWEKMNSIVEDYKNVNK